MLHQTTAINSTRIELLSRSIFLYTSLNKFLKEHPSKLSILSICISIRCKIWDFNSVLHILTFPLESMADQTLGNGSSLGILIAIHVLYFLSLRVTTSWNIWYVKFSKWYNLQIKGIWKAKQANPGYLIFLSDKE